MKRNAPAAPSAALEGHRKYAHDSVCLSWQGSPCRTARPWDPEWLGPVAELSSCRLQQSSSSQLAFTDRRLHRLWRDGDAVGLHEGSGLRSLRVAAAGDRVAGLVGPTESG